MKKILIPTQSVIEACERLIVLQEALPSILKQSWWHHQVPVSEKMEFLRELAMAKRLLWQSAQQAFPELVGKAYSIGPMEISYEDTTKESHD